MRVPQRMWMALLAFDAAVAAKPRKIRPNRLCREVTATLLPGKEVRPIIGWASMVKPSSEDVPKLWPDNEGSEFIPLLFCFPNWFHDEASILNLRHISGDDLGDAAHAQTRGEHENEKSFVPQYFLRLRIQQIKVLWRDAVNIVTVVPFIRPFSIDA